MENTTFNSHHVVKTEKCSTETDVLRKENFQHLFPSMKGFVQLISIPGEKGETHIIWIHKVSSFLRLKSQ